MDFQKFYRTFSSNFKCLFFIFAILQIIPTILQSNRVPIILVPLFMIVGLNKITDYFEDYKRKKK